MGGTEPTVTDANVVLGYLPAVAGRRRDHAGRRRRPRGGRRRSPTPWASERPRSAAAGIVDIVNENMFGGLRLVSVQQGFDPREFALVAFGGAGPLHANALGKLTGAVAGDRPAVAGRAVRARRRDDVGCATRPPAPSPPVLGRRRPTAADARGDRARSPTAFGDALARQGVAAEQQTSALPGRHALPRPGLRDPDRRRRADFRSDWPRGAGHDWRARSTPSTSGCSPSCSTTDHELVNARATVNGPRPSIAAIALAEGDGDRRSAQPTPPGSTSTGAEREAGVYDRLALRAGDVVTGPAIVAEMDSTTLVLPGHAATVHASGQPAHPSAGGAEPWRPSSRRNRRRSSRSDVDPVTLDLIENGLRNARYEMDEVLFRTALSPGIREQHDEFPLIADPSGKMVVGQFGLSVPDFLAGFAGTHRGGRRPAHLRPLRLRRGDQPRQRLAGRDADLPRRPGGRVGVDVRAHVRRRRQDPVVDADRRPHDLRGGRGHPALQALREGRAQRGRAADHPQPGAQAGLEPRRPQRPRRRLPHRRPARRRRCATGSARHLPRRARRAAASATTTR